MITEKNEETGDIIGYNYCKVKYSKPQRDHLKSFLQSRV